MVEESLFITRSTWPCVFIDKTERSWVDPGKIVIGTNSVVTYDIDPRLIRYKYKIPRYYKHNLSFYQRNFLPAFVIYVATYYVNSCWDWFAHANTAATLRAKISFQMQQKTELTNKGAFGFICSL